MSNDYMPGQALNQDLLDENASWNDSIETLLNELGVAGVSSEYVQKLACFLYAAHRHHQSLLLVGPHGAFIADALSASLYGKTAGVLDCAGSFSNDTVREAEESDDQVIVIKNIFRDFWLTSITDMLQSTKKQYFIVHPFVEDIIIEPRSLYNYTFPVITEVLVDHPAEKSFVGGIAAKTYEEHTPVQISISDSILRRLHIGKYAALRLSHILADAQDMLQNQSGDMAFLLAYFPYAYVTGQIAVLEDIQALSKDVKDCVMRFIDGSGERWKDG